MIDYAKNTSRHNQLGGTAMIAEKLVTSIKKREITSVFAVFTTANKMKDFDAELSSLSSDLREKAPHVHFNANSSAESYEFVLSSLTDKEIDSALVLFTNTSLTISESYHFGALC